MTATLTAPRVTATAKDWVLCPGCRQLVYERRLADALRVCPGCGSHHRLDARGRLATLLDEGSTQVLDVEVDFDDALGFVDTQPYPQRWEAARRRTELAEAVLVARGRIHGHPVVTAVMDFRFLGGSLGAAVGEMITLAAEVALRERTPLLLVTASGGARMQEGALSLMQMAKTAQVLGQLDEAGVLTVSLVTDPTFGGVAASFATLTDVIVAEPGARLGFAGPRVIAQTIRQSLPEGFQTAEFLLEHGLVDAVRPRHGLRPFLGRVLAVGTAGRMRAGGNGSVVTDPDRLPEVSAWDAVRRARDLERPTTVEYLHRVFDDFEELQGDRISGDCTAIVGGIARLAGASVVVIGHQKGHTPAELAAHNYGMGTPSGYRKSARLARLAAKLRIPIVTFVDTPGAYPGVEAEQQGQAVVIAENLRLFASLPVPVVTLITGEGGSGGALALAVADRVLMSANGVYSVISPEGCASILWEDTHAAPRAADALQVDARRLLTAGLVDGVVPEPDGGAGTDHDAAARFVQAALVEQLGELTGLDPVELVRSRHAKFRRFGSDRVSWRERVA